MRRDYKMKIWIGCETLEDEYQENESMLDDTRTDWVEEKGKCPDCLVHSSNMWLMTVEHRVQI